MGRQRRQGPRQLLRPQAAVRGGRPGAGRRRTEDVRRRGDGRRRGGVTMQQPTTSPAGIAGELVGTGVALAAAAASGAELFALSTTGGRWTFQELLLRVAV